MQLLATAEQMQGFDRTAIERLGIPGLVLMENAGRAFVDELARCAGPLSGKQVTVVCGKGNNGGDGSVIARHLVNRGAVVRLVLLGSRRDVKGDAATMLHAVLKMAKASPPSLRVTEVRSAAALRSLGKPDIVVDAIFGTGFSGGARALPMDAIDWINRSGGYVASVDVASGVDASTGIVGTKAVRANLTVTMACAKPGHYLGAGREQSGDVRVVDIGIPEFVLRPSRPQCYRVLDRDVAAVLPQRPVRAHKYSIGKVFLLAGSRSFTGAPFMAAQSVLKAGAGAVVVGIPQSIRTVLARKVTEVLLQDLPETEAGTLAEGGIALIREKVKWADVVAMGPGLARHPETDRLLRTLITEVDRPLLLDADGLNALEGDAAILRKRTAPTILTPHSGELGRLTGASVKAIEADRILAAREAARRFRVVVVLKGAPTVTALPDGTVFVNSSGNPGMATIGSGDVLTGIVAGLWAQGVDPAAAAWSGVFLHGRAGDRAASRLGERSLLAMDISDSISESFQSLQHG